MGYTCQRPRASRILIVFEEKNMYHNLDLTLDVPCLTVALNKKVAKMTTLQSPFFRRI